MSFKQDSNSRTRAFLSEILRSRSNLIEIFLVAILIALGIDIVSNSFSQFVKTLPLITFTLGIILCLVSILYLIIRFLGRRTLSENYEGFLVYDEENNKILSVPRYHFSEELSHYLESAFIENEALEAIWNKEPLKDIVMIDEKGEFKERRKPRSQQLICEATEYFIISELSTHLTDYFEDDKFKRENLKLFERTDIPDVLLSNRFLELFSRPMEERPHFVEDTLVRKDYGETVLFYKNGKMYERFDLLLPKDSIIKRINENKIQIETKRIILSIAVIFNGFHTNLPKNFEKYYLSHSDEEISPYQININIDVFFKFGKLFSRTGWEYYQWIDSFLEYLNSHFSMDKFLKNIGWDYVMTIMHTLNLARA